ncbi:nucleotidyltransferase domain-containing protein [bacterium]|nr:nucleotidyltransferase domain-containing protein [bacterium]MBU0899679.1 nucleotidyltransferase domain-containing protein [bacterium]MBU1152636.1 nucleotidyltransferase domain-containing protein [bacterium]MBU1781908.1 nucleotidyltransferase domain-containing protein [bacterium]MBU2600440.1 nucleotidyltransferase domain-containing protein [bacterium]
MDKLQSSSELNLSLKKNERIALRNLKEMLSQKFKIVDFRLFGSKARGEDTPESDIDVMVEVEKITSEIESQIDDIVFKINLEKDTFMSIIIFGRDEIEEGPMSESPIYKIIQKEGVQI